MASGPRPRKSAANPDMELEGIVRRLAQSDVPSNAPDIQLLRSLVSCCSKLTKKPTDSFHEELLDLAKQLLDGLVAGSWPLEEHLLSSMAFCALLRLTLQQTDAVHILEQCLQPMDDPPTVATSFMSENHSFLSVQSADKFHLGLCHGVLQCQRNLVIQNKSGAACVGLLNIVFTVLQKLCKQYSRLTIVAFRTMVKWLEVMGEITDAQQIVDGEMIKMMFATVNNNWENPISGVRKENHRILELLIDLCHNIVDKEDNMFSANRLLPTVLQEQSWKMKSKYFMLAALLPRYGVVTGLTQFPDIAPSLVSSVYHTHLVSAGCDAYRACLKHIYQQHVWCQFFLEPVLKVLKDDSEDDTGKENLYNYWLKVTLKSFPDLLPEMIQVLVTSMKTTNSPALLPIISLIHLGRKEGLINDLWEDDWIPDRSQSWRLNLLDSALQHSNEIIRKYAFGAVCSSAKTLSFPSGQEFQTVKSFLVQNANTDSAPLRQGILNSFVSFLLRIRDSFLHDLKESATEQSSVLTNSLEFLEWLHSFCISNLKPGTNYQRKILSLRLFQEVLNYLDDHAERRKNKSTRKGTSAEDVKVKSYAMTNNKWHFNSEASHECLLDCLKDPTDDIKETAGSILMEHFNLQTAYIEKSENLMKKALDLCNSSLFYETESGALMVKVAASMVQATSQQQKKETSNAQVDHLVSRLACDEPCSKTKYIDELKLHKKFEVFNFFGEKPEIYEASNAESQKTGSCAEQKDDGDDDDSFCVDAKKLLAGLGIRKYKEYVKRETSFSPRTFEGLKIMEPEALAKIRDADPSQVPETFEGLGVVHPGTGEVGQHLNFPKPEKQFHIKHHEEERKSSMSRDVWSKEKVVVPKVPEEKEFSLWDEPDFLALPSLNVKTDQKTSSEPQIYNGFLESVFGDGMNVLRSSKSDENQCEELLGTSKSNLMKRKKFRRKVKVPNLTSPSSSVELKDLKIPEKKESSPWQKSRRHRSFPSKKQSVKSVWGDSEMFPKSRMLQLPESRERFGEGLALSPAPSLDWDTGDDLFPFQDGVVTVPCPEEDDNVPVMLDEGLGEEEWWEMSNPTTVMGLLLYRSWAQWRTLCKDMYRAVKSGSPLHGLLNAMIQVIREDTTVSPDESREIVALLEDVVQHLLKVLASRASRTSGAPSFAEMSEAIENTIHHSHSTGDNSEEQISPAHQLVLNCLWLNLKACCVLASELVKNRDLPAELVQRCEQIIVQVLLRCRHKGAIEAAGEALASFVRTITFPEEQRILTTPDGRQIRVNQLPTRLVLQFLDSLQRNTNKVSTSRRSAGYAILVHKVVASDMQPGKPLVDKCVSRLLALAQSPVLFSASQLEQLKCDLPQAQALHFLCTLMQDSSLRQDMAPYISDTALLCFKNFSSDIWTIRNAALQLFGALVPKLVGEKKFQDNDSEGYGNITIEEFFSHYPQLVDYLLATMTQCSMNENPALAEHSSLVPVLSLLSKLSIGCYSLMEESLKQTIQSFNEHFIALLCSQILAVRKTAAKAFARFVVPSQILEMIVMFIKILSQEQPNENETNGILWVLRYLKERLLSDCNNLSELTENLDKELRKLFDISYVDTISWLNKAMIVEVCGVGFMTHNLQGNVIPSFLLKQILHTLKLHTSSDKQIVGIHYWALVETEFVFRICQEQDMCEVWRISFNSNWDELCLKYLATLEIRLPELSFVTKTVLFNTLIETVVGIRWLKSLDLLYNIYSTLLLLVTKHFLGRSVDPTDMQMIHLQNSDKKEMGVHCWSIVLPLSCTILAVEPDETIKSQLTLLYQMTRHIAERTKANLYDESCRFHAAKAFSTMYHIISRVFTEEFRGSLPSYEQLLTAQDISEMMLDAGTAFLQDEDSDVRKQAAKFVDEDLNPYACLEKLLEPSSMLKMLSRQQAMAYLSHKLISLESCKQLLQELLLGKTLTSPFSQGTTNIYAEEINIVRLWGKNLLLLIQEADDQMKEDLDMLLPIVLVEVDLNVILSFAYHGKRQGGFNSTVRAVFYVVNEKLSYLLKVKLALNGLNIENLQHIVEVYKKHLQDL